MQGVIGRPPSSNGMGREYEPINRVVCRRDIIEVIDYLIPSLASNRGTCSVIGRPPSNGMGRDEPISRVD